VSCAGSVPEAIILGGDSDTIACITGGIAEVFYKRIPEEYIAKALDIPDQPLKNIVLRFEKKYGVLL
jgi:ADP-ribosylglycohydrolase